MAKKERCLACKSVKGSKAACATCREAAAQGLGSKARDITSDSMTQRAKAAKLFIEKRPWYAQLAPHQLWMKFRLFGMVTSDYAAGRYRKVPWKAMVTIAAALTYVLSPLDLIPDMLVPVGWTDDMLVMGMAWAMVRRELKDYCVWKGISPAHFQL